MTVRKYCDILEGTFMVRILQPWFVNIGKRLVKRPKLYLRDSGLFHALLSIETPDQLYASPGWAPPGKGLPWIASAESWERKMGISISGTPTPARNWTFSGRRADKAGGWNSNMKMPPELDPIHEDGS